MNPQRNLTIDIFRGIAILSIVIGHLHWNSYVRNFFFSFHLPLFFIVTGLFIERSAEKYRFIPFFIHKFKKIVIPFFIAIAVSACINFLVADPPSLTQMPDLTEKFFHTIVRGSSGSLINANYSLYLWFLPPFFLFSIGIYSVFKYFSKYRLFFLIASFGISFIIWIGSKYGWYDPEGMIWGIDKLPLMLVFGMIGHYLSSKLTYFYSKKIPNLLIGFGILIFASIFDFDVRTNAYTNLGLFFFTSAAGFIVVYTCALIINKFSNYRLKKIIAILGKNSLVLYILHCFTYPIVHNIVGEPQDGSITIENIFFNIIAFFTSLLIFFLVRSISKISVTRHVEVKQDHSLGRLLYKYANVV
ncbi:acyltransferase [Candidatus Dojkabacteria bacterium]|uniref:Acyltransferase n=1 Tax=Candidatus Dojkabacteria bacterium TaxID=2099670 RepID=A0A955L7J9_9BACT|nr:acyltransferase [Candidatus Dojkabacteria bacterium]